MFFFFKQKTAYEMRISDWSSDVCSSDLLGQALEPDAEARGIHHDEHRGQALLRLADKPPRGAVIVEHAGRVAVDSHLLLDRTAGDYVPLAGPAVLIQQELRHEEERDDFHIVRWPRALGGNEGNDVVGKERSEVRREMEGDGSKC